MLKHMYMCTKALVKNFYNNISDKSFILMYHRVLVDPKDQIVPVQPGMYVTKKSFKKQLNYLTKHHKVVKLIDLLDMQYRERKHENVCSITFDDGWIDNYEVAFPLLYERNIPATFFLATNLIGTQKWFWPDEVAFFISKFNPKMRGAIFSQVNIPIEIKQMLVKIKYTNTEMLTNLVYKIKSLPSMQMEKIITTVRDSIKNNMPDLRLLMNWENVLEMHNTGLADFQPHTHNHQILTNVDYVTAEYEIKRSKEIIEAKLNKKVDCFCYPSGKYSSDIIEILQKYNIRYALTTEKGYVLSSSNQFSINRIGVHDCMSSNNILFKHVLNMACKKQSI